MKVEKIYTTHFGYYPNAISISYRIYDKDSGSVWGIRKLGRGRYAIDFGFHAIFLEFWFIRKWEYLIKAFIVKWFPYYHIKAVEYRKAR